MLFPLLLSALNSISSQELTEENRTLNRLVKRQGVVLDRISSHQGELPSLLSAHNEEVRIMRQRMKQVSNEYIFCLASLSLAFFFRLKT